VFCLALVIDPRFKKEGLQVFLEEMYENMNYDNPQARVDACIALLRKYFEEYSLTFNVGSNVASSSSQPPVQALSLEDDDDATWAWLTQKKKKYVSNVSHNELDSFLNLDLYLSPQESKNLDVLDWWKHNEGRFPIVAEIAKDLLCAPASTVASEAAFSAGKRVMTDRRHSLAPDSMQMCVCLKDWLDAEDRVQNQYEAKDDDEETWPEQ